MKRPDGPARHLKSGAEYELVQCDDGDWAVCLANDLSAASYALRIHQQYVLSNIPEDVQARLGLKETEEAQLARGENGEFAVLQVTRVVRLPDLMGKGVRMRLRK